MTSSVFLHKLELKQDAIVCPTCARKIPGVRLLPGTKVENLSVRCARCKATIAVYINQASAEYYSPRH